MVGRSPIFPLCRVAAKVVLKPLTTLESGSQDWSNCAADESAGTTNSSQVSKFSGVADVDDDLALQLVLVLVSDAFQSTEWHGHDYQVAKIFCLVTTAKVFNLVTSQFEVLADCLPHVALAKNCYLHCFYLVCFPFVSC